MDSRRRRFKQELGEIRTRLNPLPELPPEEIERTNKIIALLKAQEELQQRLETEDPLSLEEATRRDLAMANSVTHDYAVASHAGKLEEWLAGTWTPEVTT